MSSLRTTHESAPLAGDPDLPAQLILLLACSAGLAVAALYYSQPILGALGAELRASGRVIGLVPTLTQLGYALGILLLNPLGDRFDRKHMILGKGAILVAALLMAGAAHDIGTLLAASLAIGLTATLAQDIVPAAAVLAPAAHRGRVVGTVMTGLLLGILLSRVAGGLVAEHFGWRTVFHAAAVSVLLILLAAWRILPNFRPTTQLGYGDLLASLATLWATHPALRRVTLAQGLLAVGFSAFWSTLAVMLHGAPFHLGSAVAGTFGLAGAAGALAAPIAGRIADRHGPELVTRLGSGLATLSFAAMLCGTWLPPQGQLWLLGAGAVGFDLGVQATLIAHQTIIYGLDAGARSRLNSVLFVGMFTGMASGALLGSVLLAEFGWNAVLAMAAVASLLALVVRLSGGPVRAIM